MLRGRTLAAVVLLAVLLAGGAMVAGGAIFSALGNFQLNYGDVLAPNVVNVTSSVLAFNRAQGGSGQPGGNGLGGGVFNDADSSLTLLKSAVTENRAVGGQTGGKRIGGGVYNPGTFDLDALTVIRKNKASTSDDDIFGSFSLV